MRSTSSKPSGLFTRGGRRGSAFRGPSSGATANVIRAGPADITHFISSGNHPATRNPAGPIIRANHQSPSATGGLITAPVGDAQDNISDSEIASAQWHFGGQHDEEATSNRDALERIPNLFRLLDLIEEHGSGSTVEKIVIDQASLHRLLNTVQPGSYDSISKINFKSLDKLSIKATGLYGVRSEIIKYLEQARCLTDDAVRFLSDEAASPTAPSLALRSGLYLVLQPEAECRANCHTKQAYIVYWPEASTWDDRAASPSVRHNRVTFMRYLTKLTEQIVALVSPEQANNFVWNAGAHDEDQVDNNDESRLFSFEVAKSLEQEEDAIGHVGFSVQVESRHLPRNTRTEDVRFVPGEQKAGLLVSIDEPSRVERKTFRNEIIDHMSLKRAIRSSMPRIQLGDLRYDDLMYLAKHGLHEKYPEPFRKFDRCMRNDKASRYESEIADNETVNEIIKRDIPRVRQEIQNIIRRIYSQIYPSLNIVMDMPHSAETSVLQARYSGLSTVENDIKQQQKLDRVADEQFKALSDASKSLADPVVVTRLKPSRDTTRALEEVTKQIYLCLESDFSSIENKLLREYVDKVVSTERRHMLDAASQARSINSWRQQDEAFKTLMRELKDAMSAKVPHVIWVESLEKVSHGYSAWSTDDQYRWSGTHVITRGSQTRHWIYPLELTGQDSQLCRANEAYTPKPKLETRHKFEFTLGKTRNIEFLQLVHDKCLAVISEHGKSHIYIEDNLNLDQSINRKPGKVTLDHYSLGGPRCLFAFDQATRLLAIVHGEKELKLSVYIFGELFGGLRSRGSPIPLKDWYEAGARIETACFVSGTEEVCLIECSGRARIFSLITQQFYPAAVQINAPVIDAISAPDGSCLFVTVADQGARPQQEKLLAFHWASFGSNQNGIHVTDLGSSSAARVVTRLEGTGRNHVLTFSATTRNVSSVAVQVKQKATEFPFRSDHENTQATAAETFNNSLIDCHLEVWTRFPVVPAVSRCTLSPVNRQPRKLVFQSSTPLPELGDYFARMISSFEQTTRKPVGEILSSISVFASADDAANLSNGVSEFLFGSFIVELLCLIPLHLAITRGNRFIPLKDGAWDPAYEQSLLGADVPAIIDALSLGWYESLFQSYMATKLVRVVSSMGEQSVGKSYCLNHFADTSFAGSAMRTTEGVWLSCTPTEGYLLVSLEFEGVHSIERSAQENALLVLFNTAISNLVLFRNNFALSRDLAGLFTSFQSSAMVLDPNVNKGLFNSTLAIIIKDVTNADAEDIIKEFSLKFRQIVAMEQDRNFISRLHRGRIQIIPWPVINSPSFYTLFRQLRQKLDEQRFTHGTAGAFLHNLKTLMAKIKAQDWGSLDQNLAAHRTQQLLERLPRALCDGRTEEGPLKNMNTDEDLTAGNEGISFFVPEFTGGTGPENDVSVETSLRALIRLCGSTVGARQHIPDEAYMEIMQGLIYQGLDQRIDQVRNWTTVNVARFPQGNQDIRNLFGKLNSAALAMRAAVRLCSVTCSSCQLHCLRPHRHADEAHQCGTDHRCAFDCAIAEEHSGREPCGLPAGHAGPHMCGVRAHSCGSDCHLSNRNGCAWSCIKPPFHEGEHLCSARSHLCGKRCDLRNAGQRSAFNCPGTCSKPWNEPHSRHACDNARACPIECMLCKRLCCDTDHFHGLDFAAVHLCDQEHSCMGLCEAGGICQIETRPSAIQEQFSGRHETFRYTRYLQVGRRLSCVVPILPGQLTHTGPHTHSTDDDVSHFCDARCPNCEYFCTLPLGHPQRLHETGHGLMTTTKWVVEGDDASPVHELQGRKFGPGDEETPMLCSMACAARGRHAHIDYCHGPNNCNGPECEHIQERIHPEPNRPKDWVSHGLAWARSGFKDPYSQAEQLEFSKCDVLCAGPEHELTAKTAANPSYCTLPIFHAPQAQQPAPATGLVSLDGHVFNC